LFLFLDKGNDTEGDGTSGRATGTLYDGTKKLVHPHFSYSLQNEVMPPSEHGFVTAQSSHDQTWNA
jgi:hypothetical protein